MARGRERTCLFTTHFKLRNRYCESVLQTRDHWTCCDSWRVNFPSPAARCFFEQTVWRWSPKAVDGWSGIHELTATERQKKASEEPICSWISQAWKAIPSEMIATSFLKCGITNNSDGSKYNLVYNRDHWWTWWFSHRKPIWIELRVGIWRFRCLKTLNILLKSYAMQWWYSS